MSKKNRIVYIVISVLVIVSVFHAWYRITHPIQIPDEIYSGSQGERLETWNNMHRLKLTDENIASFVDVTLRNEKLVPPNGTLKCSFDTLTESQKTDIRDALVGFFRAYRGEDYKPVYDYLAVSRGTTQFLPDLKKTVQGVARQSGYSRSLESDEEVFAYTWDEIGSKGIGWESLLDTSGECCFWEISSSLNADQSIQMVLTDPALFGNTTSMGHVFTISLRLNEMLERGNKISFCDIFFVAELNRAKDQDFCATGIRFWFDETEMKWIPRTLVLVTPKIRQDIKIPF